MYVCHVMPSEARDPLRVELYLSPLTLLPVRFFFNTKVLFKYPVDIPNSLDASVSS